MLQLFFLSFFLISATYTVGTGSTPAQFPCKADITPSPECSRCTLKEWADKVNTLKERPIEFSSLPSKAAYQKNILTLKEFLSTLEQCTKTVADLCCEDGSWLHNKSLYNVAPEVFELNRPFVKPLDDVRNFPFKPYTCRLLTKPNTTCALFGDLHGSVHSLTRNLLKLCRMGFLDDNFKIKKKDFYILFLGDYIDRGIYGVEVIYTIVRLKIANPKHVIIVRGNHEDYILAPDFRKKHTKEEEKDNTPSFIDELYRKFDLSQKDEVAIFRFYEILPQALYLGCGNNKHQDYMMCCHGGPELGYNPYDLLHANECITHELIDKLWRKKYFNKKLPTCCQNNIKLNFNLDILCGDIQDFVPTAPFSKVTPYHSAYIGFMWNDFYVDPAKKVGQRGKKFTGWVLGSSLANAMLSWGTSKQVTLQGVFRAHQHNNDTGGPMLNLLCCSKGIVNVWENNNIYTLVSAPDSKLDDTGERCFTYDSFVLVRTAQDFRDWRITHYYRDQAIKRSQWTKKITTLHDRTHTNGA